MILAFCYFCNSELEFKPHSTWTTFKSNCKHKFSLSFNNKTFKIDSCYFKYNDYSIDFIIDNNSKLSHINYFYMGQGILSTTLNQNGLPYEWHSKAPKHINEDLKKIKKENINRICEYFTSTVFE